MSWKFQLCDLNGIPISWLSNASGIKMSWVHNRPTSITGNIPSWDTAVANIHTDTLPYLTENARVIKCFRQELQPDGVTLANVIRLTAIVFNVQDDGDEDKAVTGFTAYDPLQKLASRFVYDGSDPATASATLVNFTADQIDVAQTIVDRSAAVRGRHGVTTDPALGALFPPSTVKTFRWERKTVADAFVDMTNADDGFDIELVPLDRHDGILAALKCYPYRGSTLRNIAFGWDTVPYNVSKMKQVRDGTQLANDVTGLGQTMSAGDVLSSRKTDTQSISIYDAYESTASFPDAADVATLGGLTDGALSKSKTAQRTITIVPARNAPLPWVDPATGAATWNVGDTFPVAAGTRLRGGFATSLRCYGFDLEIDGNGNEVVTAIQTAPDAAA